MSESRKAESFCKEVVDTILKLRGVDLSDGYELYIACAADVQKELDSPDISEEYLRGYAQGTPAVVVATRIQNMIWDRTR